MKAKNSNLHGIALSILQIIPSVMRFLAAEMRQANQPISPPQLGILTLLAQQSHNLSELAEQHSVSLPTMSAIVSKMVAAGWVERQRSTQDRRVVMFVLTPAGRTLLEEIGQQFIAKVAEQLTAVPANNLDDLQKGLTVLQTIFTPFVLKKDPSA